MVLDCMVHIIDVDAPIHFTIRPFEVMVMEGSNLEAEGQ